VTSVYAEGWLNLKNGELTLAAIEKGFTSILTQDKLFAESSAQTLKKYPRFAIVQIILKQKKEAEYL
jgi:hypothetical protein